MYCQSAGIDQISHTVGTPKHEISTFCLIFYQLWQLIKFFNTWLFILLTFQYSEPLILSTNCWLDHLKSLERQGHHFPRGWPNEQLISLLVLGLLTNISSLQRQGDYILVKSSSCFGFWIAKNTITFSYFSYFLINLMCNFLKWAWLRNVIKGQHCIYLI